jgi:hypothetical protein
VNRDAKSKDRQIRSGLCAKGLCPSGRRFLLVGPDWEEQSAGIHHLRGRKTDCLHRTENGTKVDGIKNPAPAGFFIFYF